VAEQPLSEARAQRHRVQPAHRLGEKLPALAERKRARRRRRVRLEAELALPGGDGAIEQEQRMLAQQPVRVAGRDELELEEDRQHVLPALARLLLRGERLRGGDDPARLQELQQRQLGMVGPEVLGRAAAEADLQHPPLLQLELQPPRSGVERGERVEPDGRGRLEIAALRNCGRHGSTVTCANAQQGPSAQRSAPERDAPL
jgi:hypothetical protein